MTPTGEESVTVAFELAGLEQLAAPGEVYEQTAQWAAHVGILSDRPTHVVTGFAREHGLDLGFHSGPRDLLASLSKIRGQPELDADRYVLIGTEAVDEGAVSDAHWAFLDVGDAADAAGWARNQDASTGEDASWL